MLADRWCIACSYWPMRLVRVSAWAGLCLKLKRLCCDLEVDGLSRPMQPIERAGSSWTSLSSPGLRESLSLSPHLFWTSGYWRAEQGLGREFPKSLIFIGLSGRIEYPSSSEYCRNWFSKLPCLIGSRASTGNSSGILSDPSEVLWVCVKVSFVLLAISSTDSLIFSDWNWLNVY